MHHVKMSGVTKIPRIYPIKKRKSMSLKLGYEDQCRISFFFFYYLKHLHCGASESYR